MSEPRRSVRSTKGVNNRLSEINAEPVTPVPKKRGKKSTTPRSVEPEEPAEKEGGADDIIRCVCGAKEEDEDDERMMIQCEGCDAWQHTQCMGIPKRKIPDQYFCEICKPERHVFLLEQMERGEKPWEKKSGGKRRKSTAAKQATPAKQTTPAKQVTPAMEKKKERTPSIPKAESTPAKQKKQPQPRAERVTPVTPVAIPAPVTPSAVPAAAPQPPTPKVETTTTATPAAESLAPLAPITPPAPPAPLAPLPVSAPEPIAEPSHENSATIAVDKMDIDPPVAVQSQGDVSHGKVQMPESSDVAMVDREATIPAEDMAPPPPEPIVEAPALQKQESLPRESPPKQESPKTPAPKPKQKKETKPDSSAKQGKRKAVQEDSDTEYHAEEDKEPEKKVRRVSQQSGDPIPKTAHHERRRSSASGAKSTAPKKQQKADDTTPQLELVDSISKLRNTSRQKVAEYIITQIIDRAKALVDNGTLGLRDDVTAERLCEDLVLQAEHYVYVNHFKGGEITPEYTKKARSIGFNLKSNPALSDEFLGGRLIPERLASMSTEEMASKELKEFTQQARLESEKQHTLIKEEGPRIRRTHKGEELVDEIKENVAHNGQDTLLGSGAVHRRPTEPLEETLPPIPTAKSPSAAVESPTTATASETPRSPSVPTSKPPPPIDTQAQQKKERSFSLDNIWSHVESPDTDRVRPTRPLAQTPISAKPPDTKIDKDIDMLLKDDDHDEGTPPYSPASFDDHYSPPPTDIDDGTTWHGIIEMNSIVNFSATATLLGGPEQLGDKKWMELLDPVLNIYGRIQVDRATEYLCGQKFSKSSTLVMTSLSPADSRSQGDFDRLFDYFKQKNRYAVVNKHSQQCIKDLYIVPVDANQQLPDWFNVVDPPSKVPAQNRSSKMLVLIFVVIRNLVPGAQAHGTPTPTPTTAPGLAGPSTISPHPMVHPPQPSFSPHQPQQPYPPPPPQPGQFQNSLLQQQSYPQHYQQYPAPQPSISRAQPQPMSQSPQPVPHHPQPGQLPPQMQLMYTPKHEMTKELIKMLPRMANEQVMAIDNLLTEKPQLQTDPQALSKEIEKVLGPPQPPPGHIQHPPPPPPPQAQPPLP